MSVAETIETSPDDALRDCVRHFEARFSSVAEDLSGKTPDVTWQSLCSGGARQGDEPVPVLCSSAELAVAEWKRVAALIPDKKHQSLIWRERPALEMFVMTMQDAAGTQRVVTNRYVVLSSFAIVKN